MADKRSDAVDNRARPSRQHRCCDQKGNPARGEHQRDESDHEGMIAISTTLFGDGGRMTRRVLLATGLGVLIGSTRKLFAHHSTAMYDMANPVTVKGTVKRFEWTNPHAFIFLDVKDEKAGSVEWEIELMSLNHLRSYGWMRTTVKPGDVISVHRWRGQERRAVDDQRRDRTARRSQDSVVGRRTHASASGSHRSHPRDCRRPVYCRRDSRCAAAPQRRREAAADAPTLAVPGSRSAARAHHVVHG